MKEIFESIQFLTKINKLVNKHALKMPLYNKKIIEITQSVFGGITLTLNQTQRQKNEKHLVGARKGVLFFYKFVN